MRHNFFETTFTDTVKAEQERHGSRAAYDRLGRPDRDRGTEEALGDSEIDFIAARDSFYLGTVSETGWPHVQHRGGPPGFVRVLDSGTLGWADLSGNRQYISIGNAAANDRVALFFMDYPGRRRLKVLGRMRAIEIDDRPDLEARLNVAGSQTRTEHFILVDIAAFDWNCPQHITPRFTVAEVETIVAPLRSQIEELQARIAQAGSDR